MNNSPNKPSEGAVVRDPQAGPTESDRHQAALTGNPVAQVTSVVSEQFRTALSLNEQSDLSSYLDSLKN